MLFVLSILSFNSFSQTAPVLIPTGGFAIDGNLKANLTAANVGDWVAGPGGTGGFVINDDGSVLDASKTFVIDDPYNSSSDIIFTEGSKGNSNPNTDWAWANSTAPDKNEINKALIHLARDANDDVWMMMGGDRLSTNGTAYIDFELLQNSLTRNTNNNGFTSAGPDGGRTVNDLLITIEYNNGGGVSSVIFYKWQSIGGGKFDYVLIPAPGPSGFAVTNSAAVAVPFGAFGSTTYSALQFVEAAVNVSQVINVGAESACQGLNIKTVVIKTKASSSASAALKDLVEPLQVSFSIGAVTLAPVGVQCLSGSAVTLVGSPIGGTYSGPGVSGNTFDPAVAGVGTHKIYYSKELKAGCIKKDSILITVNAASVAGTVNGAATVCSGSNDGSVSVTGKTGDVVRWEIMPQGGSWTAIPNSAGLTSISYNNLTATTSYRVVVKSGVCPEATSAAATITITTPSAAGVITGGATVCSGSNGSLSVSGQTGSIVKWEQMPQGGSWSTVPNSAGQTSINYTNLTVTTSYRVVVKNGVCPEATSAAATVTITAPSVAGNVSGAATVCPDVNSGSVSVSGQVGTIVKWQKMPQGGSWSDVAGSAGLTSISYTNLGVTTSYRVVVKNGVCPEATSATVTITVTQPAVGGSVTGNTIVCEDINVAAHLLTLTGYTGNIIRWEKSVNNGLTWVPIANTSNTYNYGVLTQKTIFRAVVQIGDCPVVYSNPLTVIVISCGPAGNHCTYTQGFYGNVGGLGCSGGLGTGNTMENASAKMLKAFDYIGQTKVVFGREDIGGVLNNDRAFTLFKAEIANGDIFKMLPGGGTAAALGVKDGGLAFGDTYEGATYSVPATWDAVPLETKKPNVGKIRNVLLAQTMALFFNMHNGTYLEGFALHDTLYVKNFDCLSGNPIDAAPILKFGFPKNVITYLGNNGGIYTKDVAGLYKLANDILGGVVISGITAFDVNNAVDGINNAFDGCRSMVGFLDAPRNGAPVLNGRIAPIAESRQPMMQKNSLSVSAYPNPYTDKVRFSLESPVSGNGTLEVYNMVGQKVSTVFQGYVFAGRQLFIDYKVLPAHRGNLIYVLKVGNQRVSGKLINPKQ